MPSTIPYNPALALGSIVSVDALHNVEAIAKAQAPVAVEEDALNSLISSKQSLELTKVELGNLGVPTDALDRELKKLNESIERAAASYHAAKSTAEPQVRALQNNMRSSAITSTESPIDLTRTGIKSMPLAADSSNVDLQYFAFDDNAQNTATFTTRIASHISRCVSSIMAPGEAANLASAATCQVEQELQQHSIQGTMVLSIISTHKNATVYAPFVLQVDKAIKAWNRSFPDRRLDPTARASMMRAALDQSQEDKLKLSIISGMTYGSCCIGMVHVLKESGANVSDSLTAAIASMQTSLNTGSYPYRAGGGGGIDSDFASNLKNLLSQQGGALKTTVLTVGANPAPAPGYAKPTGQDIESDSASDVRAMAEASRRGNTESALQPEGSGSIAIESHQDRNLDVNGMMKALDEYLLKVSSRTGGVPINYYLKDIDAKMLAEMWLAKYFPGEALATKYGGSH